VTKKLLRISLPLIGIALAMLSQVAFTQDSAAAAAKTGQGKGVVIYPGQGTTINGKAVYVSALLALGDRVQTTIEKSEITVGSVDLEIAPNSNITISEPLVLNCGTLLVLSGKIPVIADAFTVGQSAHASSRCEGSLPDSPGTSWVAGNHPSTSAWHRLNRHTGAPSAATGFNFEADSHVENRWYWAVNGLMFGSSILSAELTQACLGAGKCDFVPDAFHSRGAMYGAGIPAAMGVSYLGYYLEKRGHRWWFVPAAMVTVGNIVVSAHAAHYSH